MLFLFLQNQKRFLVFFFLLLTDFMTLFLQIFLKKHCEKLLDEQGRCTIKALGAAVSLAVEVALEVEKCWQGLVNVEVTTGTVELLDEHLPQK